MSDAVSGNERAKTWPVYVTLAALFFVLVIAGVFTVALPELADDPERVPDAGTPSVPR